MKVKPNSAQAVIQRAKAMALSHLNANRIEIIDGKPLKQVNSLWWSMYGDVWIVKARQELAEAINAKQS